MSAFRGRLHSAQKKKKKKKKMLPDFFRENVDLDGLWQALAAALTLQTLTRLSIVATILFTVHSLLVRRSALPAHKPENLIAMRKGA